MNINLSSEISSKKRWMIQSPPRRLLSLSVPAQKALVAGARDAEPVQGLTHNFYKYPARFSPAFARAAIEAFTQEGDLILDPHVGGGTSLVEAIALGRSAVGVDISSLAEFVATAKTIVHTDEELSALANWAALLPSAVNLRKFSIHFADYEEQGYYRHLDHSSRWRLRKAIEQSLGSAMSLSSERLETFARCVVLRTAQWALDGRKQLPTVGEFRAMLGANAASMISGARSLLACAKHNPARSIVKVLHRSAVGIERDGAMRGLPSPRLVLTSPPYPGVHVLYHRWQVDGRKEGPLPFWIAGKLDGAGSSFYTMGDRKNPGLRTYFEQIGATMSSVAALADENTTIVQMVAFSDPSWQLPRYIETMEDAGLAEVFLSSLQDYGDGRLWRSVPNRRWYSNQRGETPASQEVVLIHVKARPSTRCALNAELAASVILA